MQLRLSVESDSKEDEIIITVKPFSITTDSDPISLKQKNSLNFTVKWLKHLLHNNYYNSSLN